MGSPASKEGDVYSYGILVLEMFSGKRPTDGMFKDSLNLHNFVRNELPQGLKEIMDEALLSTASAEDQDDNNRENLRKMRANDQLEKCLLSVFEVGVACSREWPKERMNMGEVVKELHLIKSNFLGVRIYG